MNGLYSPWLPLILGTQIVLLLRSGTEASICTVAILALCGFILHQERELLQTQACILLGTSQSLMKMPKISRQDTISDMAASFIKARPMM